MSKCKFVLKRWYLVYGMQIKSACFKQDGIVNWMNVKVICLPLQLFKYLQVNVIVSYCVG